MINNTLGAYGALAGSLGGIDIISNPLCVRRVYVREHVKKRWMDGTVYHQRIQKKWMKRYGCHDEPAAYLLGDRTLAAHPLLLEKLRQVSKQQADIEAFHPAALRSPQTEMLAKLALWQNPHN